MNSIDRLSGQEAARTYVQNADVARTGGAPQTHKAYTHHAQPSQSVDSVTLSESARSLAAARDAVQNAPDVREQKVAEIKQQVTSGTYTVSARVLARKMLETSDIQA
jgi:negative regulator of flagellin synthesis FlgM